MSDSDARQIFDLLRDQGESLARIQAIIEYHGEQLTALATDVSGMARQGCAMGQRHEVAIKALEDRPNRMLGTAATVAGLISALAAGLAWFVNASQ